MDIDINQLLQHLYFARVLLAATPFQSISDYTTFSTTTHNLYHPKYILRYKEHLAQ
jgi:hypothetical protein